MKGERHSLYLWGKTLDKLERNFPYEWVSGEDRNRSALLNRMLLWSMNNGFGATTSVLVDMQRLRDEFDLLCKLLLDKGILVTDELGARLLQWLYEKGIIGTGV